MFARYLAAPFVLCSLLFLYLAWSVDSSYAPWMVPFIVICVLIFILSPQINWWWYTRRPPQISKGLRELLQRFCVFYQGLSKEDQKKFEGRIGLFRMGTNWTPIGWPEEELPPDVELALAAQAVSLLFHREELLFNSFEKVIVYPKPFPSPEHPYPHSSELYAPDGCLIFSAENTMRAFFKPGQLYQVGLHEYAKAFILAFPNEPWPVVDTSIWSSLEYVSGMSREHVEHVVGLSDLAPLPVAIHHCFIFPANFKSALPELYEQFQAIFSKKQIA